MQKDFIASGTSGVHFVLSTSVRSRRNISACCGTFVSDMCTPGCTGSICTFFCRFPSHLWEKEGVLHHEFHDEAAPSFFNRNQIIRRSFQTVSEFLPGFPAGEASGFHTWEQGVWKNFLCGSFPRFLFRFPAFHRRESWFRR